ncbi:hypothetical protein [Ammoniphilus resinae]|uniref:Uncharacterized protein n=1 Tax=Ammoniphilus resinae TaxID=861532 RepID=A0ABS4GSF4_9BACL|nr:hypothetical protein [Ammoniphilus resinae]MBP1933215.1 hypothetical protein [Ammoniphilus resinae]
MLDRRLLIELEEYIERHPIRLHNDVLESPIFEESCSEGIHPVELEDFIRNTRKPAFSQVLFGFIDRKGITDSDVYKKAGIDRRLFSKIRSNSDYRPRKNTVIALALSLELNKKETGKLLGSAGYSLSDSDTFDLVIQFCLEKRIYNIHDINQALAHCSLKPLACVLE